MANFTKEIYCKEDESNRSIAGGIKWKTVYPCADRVT